MGSGGREVGVAGTPEDLKVGVRGSSAEEVQEVGGSVEALSPVMG
jgi:hypothetical protein